MRGAEEGFLLLSSRLGNPERRPLTAAQLRLLAQRMAAAPRRNEDRDLTAEDLKELGYGGELARRILELLGEEAMLRWYLHRADQAGCVCVTRVSERYPLAVRRRLGPDSPGCLWAKGDPALLDTPKVALVGSRDLAEENAAFAAEVGRQAALQGYTLVSGNARGADRTAQNACLKAGGKVISVVADELAAWKERENVLYLSEEDFDAPFSAQRALSRNRVIHALGTVTFVAQCSYQSGGTWDGTVKNLRFGWSPVFCFDDGSPAAELLCQMGAQPVDMACLRDFDGLQSCEVNLFDQ